MWQVAVLWCYVEGVSTVKVAARLETVVNNQHLELKINHLCCCILLVFFLHAMHRVFWSLCSINTVASQGHIIFTNRMSFWGMLFCQYSGVLIYIFLKLIGF